MALQLNGACWCFYDANGSQRMQNGRNVIRAVTCLENNDANNNNIGRDCEKLRLGGSDLEVTKLGIGTWSWGENAYWNNFQWDEMKLKAAKAAFNTSLDNGMNFIDTAELYGSRLTLGAIDSETLLGRFIKERKEKDPEVEVTVATKFTALPWRLGRENLAKAIKHSLCRLGLSSVDLYQLHWPGIWGNEGYIDGLGDAVEKGLVKAVGICNHSEKRLRDAYHKLKKRGIPLASNQVNYSLTYRLPEENGVKATCDELGITLIAYAPIGQGTLSGKYTPENPPAGLRGLIYPPNYLTQLPPLMNKIEEIGQSYNKTPIQVVLNWLIAQGNVVPIPGAKDGEQAMEFMGALGWRLSNEDIEELRYVAKEIRPIIGFPIEKF